MNQTIEVGGSRALRFAFVNKPSTGRYPIPQTESIVVDVYEFKGQAAEAGDTTEGVPSDLCETLPI